jgi:hypothetical protein
MRILTTLILTAAVAIALAPDPASAQLPSDCRNNNTSRCAQRIALSTSVEGLIDGRTNNRNFFVVVIHRPGLYNFLTTREPHPRGQTAGIKVDIVDSEGSSLLNTWLFDSEDSDLIEISVPGRYIISMNYGGSGNLPVVFTVELRPRPRARN